MIQKVYVNNGQKVFLGDSEASREINSVLKDATVFIENGGISLERSGRRVILDFEDFDQDEEGFYLVI